MGQREDNEASFYAAMLQELSYIKTHTSDTAEMLATGVANHVLEVSTKLINADGYVTLAWGATCGSIEVHNHGTNPMTVQSSTPGTPSTQGIGVSRVIAGVARTIPINSRFLTIYGTAGDAVGIVAYSILHSGKP